jgi:Holliday junction DNA helicase RuvA
MIHYIKGHWRQLLTGGLVIVNDIGYRVKTSDSFESGDLVELFITPLTSASGETSLYGFSAEKEQMLFNELIKIQGIGGSLALNIISGFGYEPLVDAVMRKDVESFKKVKGMGTKTASRILSSLDLSVLDVTDSYNDIENQSIKALISLGFKGREASALIKSLESENLTSVEEYVAKALQLKGRSYNVS